MNNIPRPKTESKIKPKTKPKTKIIGDLGEQIALRFLENQGLILIESNFSCKFGEIDLVVKEVNTPSGTELDEGSIHFIEVKTVSRITSRPLNSELSRETCHFPDEIDHISHNNVDIIDINVTHETVTDVTYETSRYVDPLENLHQRKLLKLINLAEFYILSKGLKCDYQIDAIGVALIGDRCCQKAFINYIESIA